jgi:hypothetical protein
MADVTTYTVKDTTNSKATTNNKTFELTKYLITKKTINISDDSLTIQSMTVSFVVSNEYRGYHKVNFYVKIGASGSEKTFSSPYKTGIYGNGGYTRVTLTIPIYDENDVSNTTFTVEDYNRYINNSQVKLYMSVTRTSGSGTLWYRGDNGADPYITYNLGVGTHFSAPFEGSEIKQYSNLIATIENIPVGGDYQIYVDGDNSTIQTFNNVEQGASLEYNKSIGGLSPGEHTLKCVQINQEEQEEPLCSVNFQVIENQIFSIIPEFNRYNFNGSSYESSFNGDYVGLSLNITTLVNDFINKNYYAKLQYKDINNNNDNYTIKFEGLIEQQFILDVFSIEGENKPNNELDTSIKFEISNDKDYSNILYSLIIQVPQPSVIFNVEENGVSVGMLSHMKNQFESAWPAIFYDSIYLTDMNNSTKYYKLGISNGVIVITEENPFSNNS